MRTKQTKKREAANIPKCTPLLPHVRFRRTARINIIHCALRFFKLDVKFLTERIFLMPIDINANSFAENFSQCCTISSVRSLPDHQDDDDFREARAECDTLYRLIAEKLGEERLLINRFDAAKNAAGGLREPLIYRQGFQDCVYLLRWIGAL